MHVPAWPVLPDSTLAPENILEKFRVRALAGLGCGCSTTDDTGTCLDPEPCIPVPPAGQCPGSPGCPGYIDPSINSAIQAAIPPVTVQTSSGSTAVGYTVPNQNTAQWLALSQQLLKQGFTLAEINSIQPGTVVSANGQILRQAPGIGVPVSSTNLGLQANTGGGLLAAGGGLAVAAVVGLVALMMFNKGR